MESCTSGMIASMITDTEGASAIFPGGFVTYLNETKILIGVDAKVIEVGATTDTAKSLQAQQMMTDEAAPKYQALDDALQKLMALNISLGNAKRAQLRTVMIAALTIIIIVIAVSTIYSNSLSVAISKSIEKPLNELKTDLLHLQRVT